MLETRAQTAGVGKLGGLSKLTWHDAEAAIVSVVGGSWKADGMGICPGDHVTNHFQATGNSINYLILPANGRWARSVVKLDVHGLCVRLAHAEVFEQDLPIWSIHSAPFAIVVLLPSHVEKRWRCVPRGWEEGKHQAP